MKKIIITYGLIGGAIISTMMLTQISLIDSGVIDMDKGMLLGYTSMVIALSMVFFGVKNYRDNQLKGVITFWEAFKMGILITAVSSLMYAISWEFYYNLAASDFTQKYSEYYIDKMTKEGATADAIAAKKAEMVSFSEWYKNPLLRFGMTIMEILPVGLIVTLITAALLRKKEVFPASPVV